MFERVRLTLARFRCLKVGGPCPDCLDEVRPAAVAVLAVVAS